MNSNEEKMEYSIKKEFYNLEELCTVFETNFNEINIDRSKYREKIIELFAIVGIDTDYLKDKSRSYRIPRDSVEFMHDLYALYIMPEGQELRKGHFDKVGTETLEWIIKGFDEMLCALNLPYEIINDQVQEIARKLDIMELRKKEMIKILLESMYFDFFPQPKKTQMEGNEAGLRPIRKGIRYRRGALTKKEMYLFFEMVEADLKEIQYKHHKIFEYMNDIRNSEIIAMSEKELDAMNDEENALYEESIEQQIRLMEYLQKDNRYQELQKRSDEIIRPNGFSIDKEREYNKISRELAEIEKQYVDKYFGGKILEPAECRPDVDFLDKSSEDVFLEAFEEYVQNDSIESFAEKLRKKKNN